MTFWGLLLVLIQACKPGLNSPSPYMGFITTDNFLAIGDGYSAGISNQYWGMTNTSGWYEKAQRNAYPALLVGQFRTFQPVTFHQPILSGPGSGHLVIDRIIDPLCPEDDPQVGLEKVAPIADWQQAAFSKPINHWAVPKLRISGIDNEQYHLENPFWNRLIQGEPISYQKMVKDFQNDFFTIWIGLDELLPYLLSGGSDPGLMPTDPGTFENAIDALTEALLTDKDNSRGVILNIPDPLTFPYFNRVSPNYESPGDCSGKQYEIYAYKHDEFGNLVVGVLEEGDYILLPVENRLGTPAPGGGYGLSPNNPLRNEEVVDAYEANLIHKRVEAYNAAIFEVVREINLSRRGSILALADVFTPFQMAGQNGLKADGILITNEYLSGGLFSLDGLTLTPRGQAVVANIVLETINSFRPFEANIPPLSVTEFEGIVYP